VLLLTLTRLIKSLSGPEKRAFMLATRKQQGKKDYVTLFTIIDKNDGADPEQLSGKFSKMAPASSINNSARYLLRALTDSLIESKRQKDNFFYLLQEIMRVRVLRERSLDEEAEELLKTVRESAVQSQQHLLEYFTLREELNYSADNNFSSMDDTVLVNTQMRSKDVLRSLNHIQDHHSLFELMKYRLVHSGKIGSEDDKKRLNDLMLSEMTLVAGKSKNSFASQKLHLLFQSFFFTDIGDYQSALHTFHLLDKSFEKNLKLLDSPPLDYLATIDGILESLSSLGKYEEMQYYIEKLGLFDKVEYPEYFRYQSRKATFVYQMAILVGRKEYAEAVKKMTATATDILKLYEMINEQRQWEIYFYTSLAYFGLGQWRKAHEQINVVMQRHKSQPQLYVCRALRLLNILVYYERGEASYLEYEIRSYKRMIKKGYSFSKTENMLLKFVLQWPDVTRKKIANAQRNHFISVCDAVAKDRYEQQLLKYFDFAGWLKGKVLAK
jgi:hypothetical protein